jgi:hypothetical protein
MAEHRLSHLLLGSAVVMALAVACSSSTSSTPPDPATSEGGTEDGGSPTAIEGGVDGTVVQRCEPGLTACGSACADTNVDPKNCGTCGNTCPVACAAGACVTTCPATTTNCSGACVDVTASAANCGSCGNSCAAGKVCTASACSCGATVGFGSQIQVILTAECATTGCHTGNMPKGGLALGAGKSYAALVDVASSQCGGKVRVKPGASDQSYLMNKLTGVGICSGTVMPKTGGELTPAEIDLFRAWICNGAPNN